MKKMMIMKWRNIEEICVLIWYENENDNNNMKMKWMKKYMKMKNIIINEMIY